MSYSLGVDLGTTFAAAAVARPTGVEMATLGERSVVMPAVVHLAPDGHLITGDAAERRAVTHPGLVAREVRRALADPTPILLGGVAHRAPELLAALLRDVVRKVVDAEGGSPEHLVLTHPAQWGPHRRELFGEVAATAGLGSPRTVTEAEAAVHHALAGRLGEGAVVAVYDLGGGTFDATVVRRRADGVEVLGVPDGFERLGGVDFDEAILSYVDESTGGALSGLDEDDAQAAAAVVRLRQDCLLAKEALSLDTETVIPVFLPGRHVDVRLTRADFEEMVRPAVESTVTALSRTLQSAGLEPSDLHAVLLVGGSSRIPLIAETVARELGRPVVDHAHPMYAVALGAASIAASLPEPAAVRAAADGAPTVSLRGPAPDDPTGVAPVEVAPVEVAPVDVEERPAVAGAPAPAVRSAPSGPGVPGPIDGPTELLHRPRLVSEPPSPIAPASSPPPHGRVAPVALAAALAVLVLVLVFVLFP